MNFKGKTLIKIKNIDNIINFTNFLRYNKSGMKMIPKIDIVNKIIINLIINLQIIVD